ncbi:PepSY domain-containing protein [Halobacillus sp. H74]|uniref:PepSY domain-containing protein n=1 Tax=Halobacillus sp. H74 TaxID=3457436 RepID=UPI003FCDAF43
MSKSIKLIISIVGLFVLLIIGWQIVDETLNAQPLSKEQAMDKIQGQYHGTITDFVSMDDHYLATIELEKGLYEIAVLKDNGRIADMKRIEEGAEEEDNSPEPPRDEKTDSENPITEEQAREAALKEVDGTVDDVDFETEDEVSFYLVEVEKEDESEATIQVHAITGEIMTVSWDD